MNRKNLEQLFRNYIDNFEFINNPAGHNEKYKWDAVEQVQKCWDLNANNLADMIKCAFSQSYNLINNRIVQPVSGLVCAAREEPKKVYKALEVLLEDTEDVDEKQDKIAAFADEINAILEKHYPGKWKYTQDNRSVIMYLAMIDPAHNYMFKSTPAHYFARWMEYPTDIGSGATFKLKHYYSMCDELVAAIRENPEVIAKEQERKTTWKDNSYHMMAWDMIYSFTYYKELHGDIPEPAPRNRSSSGKQSEAERMRIAEGLQAEMEALQDQIDAIEKEINELPKVEFAGKQIKTKAFGEVTIERQEENYVIFTAGGKERQFVLPDCVTQGFIIPEDPKIIELCNKISGMRAEAEKLSQQQRLKTIELRKYQ